MNTINDELLMAYVDGELDEAPAARVAMAVAADPALSARVAREQALRRRLQAALQPDLDAAVPARLLAALQADTSVAAPAAVEPPAPPSPVISLDAARAERTRRAEEAATAPTRTGWGWAQWGGMAASLLLGLVVARVAPWGGAGGEAGDYLARPGQLLARGELAAALDKQLASAPPAVAAVSVQLSFVDQSGQLCRTYTASGLAGLACRDGGDWALRMLVPAPTASGTVMRQAATALPPELLSAVDQRIAGNPLDADAERAALQRGWKPAR